MLPPLAPIVLFVYNRPWLLRQTLEALSLNELADQSDLYIYADGPKIGADEEQLKKIQEVRTLIRERQWCKNVFIREAEKNRGLADSIVGGVTEVVNERGRIIVIEDDVLTSRYFLQFMNDSLNLYEHEKKVLSISSWNYFTVHKDFKSNFFMQMPDTIAWATWKRSWDLFEYDAVKLYHKLKAANKMKAFNLGGRYDFEKMLQYQIHSKVSSWGIRWTAVAVLNNTLSFYPKVSLAKHIGFGADSTHSMVDDYNEDLEVATEPIEVKPIPLKESSEAVNAWVDYEKTVKKSLGVIHRSILPVKFLVFLYRLFKSKLRIDFLKKRLAASVILPFFNWINKRKENDIGWKGEYKSWKSAQNHSSGYDSENILEKVKESILKVKRGEAVYERDSVLFHEEQNSPDITDAFASIISEEGRSLHIVDFGGSLGSSYFQLRGYLKNLDSLKWSIVEQRHFVECGNKFLADKQLQFFYTIEEALLRDKPQVLLLSSVIQYLENPYQLLEQCIEHEFKYIIVDRTAFIDDIQERITVQFVPESIYKASYPAWFLNEKKFISFFTRKYEMLKAFVSPFHPAIEIGGRKAEWKGFILKKNNE